MQLLRLKKVCRAKFWSHGRHQGVLVWHGMEVDALVISKLASLSISPFFCVDVSRLWMSLIRVRCPCSVGCGLTTACTPVQNNALLYLFQTNIAFGGKRGIFTFLNLMSWFLFCAKTDLPKALRSFKSLWPIFAKYGANHCFSVGIVDSF